MQKLCEEENPPSQNCWSGVAVISHNHLLHITSRAPRSIRFIYSPSFVNGLQNSRPGFRSCSASHLRKLITSTCPLKPIVTAPLCLRPTPPLSAGSGLLQASS